MKIGLLFGLVSYLFSVKPAYAQGGISINKQDSGEAKRLYTIVVQPAKLRLGNEIALPVGVDERTVMVLSDDRVLQLWEDYVFIPDANRIRILDENALKSERPLKVSYEKLRLSLSK